MPRQRADVKDIAPHRQPPQFGNFADIDDQFRRDQNADSSPAIRLWPPDSSLALSPCAASSSSAWMTLVARGVAESRGFHRCDLPRPEFGHIYWD